MKKMTPKWPSSAAKAWFEASIERTEQAKMLCQVYEDLAYGPDARHRLDIYAPKNSRVSDLPVVIFMHGGYFTNGDKRIPGHMALGISALPALLVCINYRLAPGVRIQQQTEDAIKAIAWVYHHIDDFGGNHKKIIVAGHSSGGHLASWAALHSDSLGSLGCPSHVIKACMPISAVFDLEQVIPRITRYALESPNEAYAMSCTQATSGNSVPFCLTASQYEFPNLMASHQNMLSKLKATPGGAQEIIIPHCDHFSVSFALTAPQSPWLNQLKQYLST